MKCNNCGAELPEGKITCPNCAADPLAPKKKEQPGKYRESIKAFRRACIFEWTTFFLTEFAYVLAYVLYWSVENEDLFSQGETNFMDSSLVLPLIITAIAFAVWTAVMAYIYDSLKEYEKSFPEIIGVRAVLAVMMFVLLFILCSSTWLFFLLVLLFLIVLIPIVFSMSYRRIFHALSAYIKELSADMAAQLNQLSSIYPVLTVMIGLITLILTGLALISIPKEWHVLVLLLPTAYQLLFLIVLPIFMLRVYRLCRSAVVSDLQVRAQKT